MCGICGELRLDGQAADLALIARMNQALAHRGPDHSGSYSDGPLGLGHRRLSIIDLSPQANQPMIDPDLGLVIVFNGSIYNYPELRRRLQQRGHRFFSQGDTEVILKAYAEWGLDCPQHLDGMFAFAIWNIRQKTLFLARDRLGIKPLYWSLDQRALRFASNTQALLATGEVDTSLDAIALHHQFMLHGSVPAPRTVLKGIRKLEPGHYLYWQEGQYQIQPYWQLQPPQQNLPQNEDEWLEASTALLKQAVKKRNEIADVPVGVLLSGGVDSSLLVALLAELGQADLHTFTIGFEDQPEEKGSEFEYSDQLVARYQPQHHQFLIPNEQVLERLPEAVQFMAEPMFAQDAVAFYLLAEQVSQHIKVVQSGQGADEVFAGYFWYPQIHQDPDPDCAAKLSRYYLDRSHQEYLHLIAAPYQGEDHTQHWLRQRLAQIQAPTCLDKVLQLDVTTLIVDDPVKRVDNMTMAWGLEARVPFLDHHLVEFMAACPIELKLRSQGKHLLKRMARGRIPDAIIDRPKGYFPMPALKYVRGQFLDFMRDILLSERARQRGLFQMDYIKRLLAAPAMHHTRIRGSKLWQLALFELWLQRQGL